MQNVIIIGNGPAGISAALYTARAGFKTTVIGKDNGALAKAHLIENYYGFREPISGNELVLNGIEQAKRLGVEIVTAETVGLNFDGQFIARTTQGEWKGDGMIIATGSSRSTPNIPGLSEFEGKGVSYCAVCDAFFYRGKDVAVLGSGSYALSEASELLPVARSVTLVTNGEHLAQKAALDGNFTVNTKGISALDGESTLHSVQFQDGSSLAVSGVFIALGVAGSSDLAKKIGAEIQGNKIVTNENMETNIPGLYAAGDCTGGMLQVAKAVYEGAKAGTELVKYLRSKQQ